MSKHVWEKCRKRADGRTDGHHHTIIRPVWWRAYKNWKCCLPETQASFKLLTPSFNENWERLHHQNYSFFFFVYIRLRRRQYDPAIIKRNTYLVLCPLIVSRDSFCLLTLARLQMGGAQPTLTDDLAVYPPLMCHICPIVHGKSYAMVILSRLVSFQATEICSCTGLVFTLFCVLANKQFLN